MGNNRDLLLNEIKKTIQQLEKLKKRKWWRLNTKKRTYKLRKTQRKYIFDLLELENPEFSTIWNENMDLLANDDLLFSVTQLERNSWTGNPLQFDGKINRHGQLIASTTGKGTSFLGKQSFPKIYSGRIDSIGQLELKASSTRFQFFAFSIPKSYLGFIEADGEIVLKIAEISSKTLTQTTLAKLVCEPFKDNPTANNRFLQNRNLLLKQAAKRLVEIEREVL